MLNKHCVPCNENTPPLTQTEALEMLENLNHWDLKENKLIEKKFKFTDFKSALGFVNKVGEIAETEGHHPDIEIFNWNNVRISLSTHAIKGLSENDFILASKIDQYLRENN
jgi:4a-hydroxytetrahydrobiopterin dehydratase